MKKHNARCSECGRACPAPRGNWNLRKAVLCHLKKCHRARKTALQRERRKQKDLFPAERLTGITAAQRDLFKEAQAKANRKAKFFGQSVD